MADYIKSTNFAVKDTLSSGNPAKIVKGTEIDTEFNAIAAAVASKLDANSPTLTGTPTAPTASTATNNTQIATTAYVVNRIAQDIAGKANIASPTFTGTVTLAQDPTLALQAATKQYVDTFVSKAGSTMTGFLTLHANPSSNLHAATKQYVDSAVSGGVPSGVVVLWSGAVANIPSGWALCNGSNGTPDLRDRFVVGAGSSYSVGTTGGSKDAIVVAHTHTFSATTNTTGAHTHTLPVNNGEGTNYALINSNYIVAQGSSTGSAGDHSHTVSGTTASTGSSGTNANLPPYYALAYIMKL